MILIGLTGNLGCGKSTVASLFRKQGVKTIDTDSLARRAVEPSSPIYIKLRHLLGAGYFRRSDGALLRQRTAHHVFTNSKIRQKMNRLVHPEVLRLLKLRFHVLEKQKTPAVVVEVPLLYEAGWKVLFDAVVLVTITKPILIKRLLKRGMSLSEIESRLRAQIPAHKKKKSADFVINNSGLKSTTARQVSKIMRALAPCFHR